MNGPLDGISEKKLKSMNPVVSVMRNIYGRPSLEQIIAASKREDKYFFIVKRHPFKRLFSGFKDKILLSFKNSHHDKMSQKILEKYRGLPKKLYKHKETVPTFSEFIDILYLHKTSRQNRSYVLDFALIQLGLDQRR